MTHMYIILNASEKHDISIFCFVIPTPTGQDEENPPVRSSG